jgi:hypothetical protein
VRSGRARGGPARTGRAGADDDVCGTRYSHLRLGAVCTLGRQVHAFATGYGAGADTFAAFLAASKITPGSALFGPPIAEAILSGTTLAGLPVAGAIRAGTVRFTVVGASSMPTRPFCLPVHACSECVMLSLAAGGLR